MEENRDPKNREDLLNQGYGALKEGRWEDAGGIFRQLLSEDPGCGLSCLGLALADRQLHGREELARHWEQLQQDPEFQAAMAPAEPEFLQWLRQDMEAAGKARPACSERRRAFRWFAWVQAGLFLLTVLLFWLSLPSGKGILMDLTANLAMAVLFVGLPTALGLLYGWALLRENRFCRLLKILNALAAILTGSFYALVAVEGALSIQDRTNPQEIYYCAVFFVMALICLVSLVGTMILKKMKND